MNRRQFILAGAAIGGLALASRAAPSPPPLRVGVIGHTGRGNYGGHRVDQMWLHLPDTKIAAVADPDATGRAAAQKRLKAEHAHADYRQMLAEVKPDIVAVCPRHIDQHHEMAMAAIAAGVRGIYMEKPLCRTLVEADEIIAASRRRGVIGAVAHKLRHHPVVPVVARLIEEGVIGRFLEIRGRGKEDTRGGASDLWVLGSHVLNLAVAFTGAPVSCTATLLAAGRPAKRADLAEGTDSVGPIAGDEVHARFETERGVPIFFDSVRNAGSRAVGFGLQLIGTEGVIDLRLDMEPMAQLMAGNPFLPVTTPRTWTPISSTGLGQPEPVPDIKLLVLNQVLAGRDFIEAIRHQRRPLCSLEDGRLTVEMIMATFESHRLNGARVSFPLQTRVHPLTLLA